MLGSKRQSFSSFRYLLFCLIPLLSPESGYSEKAYVLLTGWYDTNIFRTAPTSYIWTRHTPEDALFALPSLVMSEETAQRLVGGLENWQTGSPFWTSQPGVSRVQKDYSA